MLIVKIEKFQIDNHAETNKINELFKTQILDTCYLQ